MNIIEQILEQIESKTTWGKNELKELILKILAHNIENKDTKIEVLQDKTAHAIAQAKDIIKVKEEK